MAKRLKQNSKQCEENTKNAIITPRQPIAYPNVEQGTVKPRHRKWRADRGLAQRKLCMHAGRFDRGESSSGLDFGEDISLLGAAGSGSGDAVRLMGCEGSVSLAWRTGEG